MKRRRPSPAPLAYLEGRLWSGRVIAPKSVVRLKDQTGWLGSREFRIGYYSKMDGLNVVWLVNELGEYQETVDQRAIRLRFQVLGESTESELYGKNRPVLGPLIQAS